MTQIEQIRGRIAHYEAHYGREPGSVRLLAVSKGQPAARIGAAIDQGQRDFGENYIKEALEKRRHIVHRNLCWHFIGPLQSNKTRAVAEAFDWVQSVDRAKLVHRLAAQRPDELRPLNVLLQVNLEHEPGKRGIDEATLPELAALVAQSPNLRLRGIMSIPPMQNAVAAQREQFARVHGCYQRLMALGYDIDTLSMGMSGDMEAAIAEGATMVRIGTALFGPREPDQ